MARVLGPEDGCKQVTVGGRTYDRQSDGTFHLPPAAARAARRTGEFSEARTSIVAVARGFRCPSCGHLAVFRTNCGRCGAPELEPEG